MGKYMKTYFNKFITLCFLLIGMQNTIFAFDLFRPEAKDSDLLIKYVLQPLGEADPAQNGIAAVSQTFLWGILIIGGLLLIYTIVSGNMGTALTGELMGKKFSTTFTVIRNVIGVGMLIPVGGGYATIQYIVLWISTQGVLFADMAWENFVENQPLNGQILINRKVETKILENIPTILMAQYCADVIGRTDVNGQKLFSPYVSPYFDFVKNENSFYQSDKNNPTTISFTPSNNNVSRSASQIREIIKRNKSRVIQVGYEARGKNYDQELAKSFCGEFTLQTHRLGTKTGYSEVEATKKDERAKNSTYKGSIKLENINTLTGLSYILDLDEMKNKVNEFHEKMYQKLIGVKGAKSDGLFGLFETRNVKELAKNMDGMTSDELGAEMVEIAQDYVEGLKRLAEEESKNMMQTKHGEAVLKGMTKDGIASAGAWYWAIVSQGGNFSDLLNTPPELHVKKVYGYNADNGRLDASAGGVLLGAKTHANDVMQYTMNEKDGEGNNIRVTVETKMMKALAKINQAISYIKTDGYTEAGVNAANAGYNLNGRSSELLQMFIGDKVNPIVAEDFYVRNDENPVITVHNLGKKIVWWVQGIIEAKATQKLQSNIGAIVSTLSLGLIIPGATMVWYIPLLPFILWIGTLIGWVLMVLQALFGAPLWMLAHLTPDKESFIGRQGQGYMLVLSTSIRPILMIIGLVISIQLLNPIGQLINAFFGFTAMTVLGGTGLTWLMGVITVTFIYAMILQNTVKKVFSLMHIIPDSLLQWFGGNDSKVLGEYANGIEQGASQGVSQMGGAINTIGMRMGMGAGVGGMAAGALAKDKQGQELGVGENGLSAGGANNINTSTTSGIGNGFTAAQNADMKHLFGMMDNINSGNGASMSPTIDKGLNETIGKGQVLGGYDTAHVNANESLVNPSAYQSGQNFQVDRTATQFAELKQGFAQARNDNNHWNQLSGSQQEKILNSGALSYTDSTGTHAIPPQALIDANNQSIANNKGPISQMQDLQNMGVSPNHLENYSDSIQKGFQKTGTASKENVLDVHNKMLNADKTFELGKSRR